MIRAAADTDGKQKLYFLSRPTYVGINTISKMHGMGVETLSEGHSQIAVRLINSYLNKDGVFSQPQSFCSAE